MNIDLIPAGARTGTQSIDFVDPELGQPSVWKANLAFDKELPWWGVVGAAELVLTSVKEGIYYQHLNLGQSTGVGQDGRPQAAAGQQVSGAEDEPGHARIHHADGTLVIVTKAEQHGRRAGRRDPGPARAAERVGAAQREVSAIRHLLAERRERPDQREGRDHPGQIVRPGRHQGGRHRRRPELGQHGFDRV